MLTIRSSHKKNPPALLLAICARKERGIDSIRFVTPMISLRSAGKALRDYMARIFSSSYCILRSFQLNMLTLLDSPGGLKFTRSVLAAIPEPPLNVT